MDPTVLPWSAVLDRHRIDGFVDRVRARLRVGNTYVNRNMIGAVAGVQPFGVMAGLRLLGRKNQRGDTPSGTCAP